MVLCNVTCAAVIDFYFGSRARVRHSFIIQVSEKNTPQDTQTRKAMKPSLRDGNGGGGGGGGGGDGGSPSKQMVNKDEVNESFFSLLHPISLLLLSLPMF